MTAHSPAADDSCDGGVSGEQPDVVADAVVHPPPPFPAALGIGERGVLVFTGSVFAAVDVIHRDDDGVLDHDLAVLARRGHGPWVQWSSGGGPLGEDVLDRADRTAVRRLGAQLQVLDDHVCSNAIDGRKVWAVAFLLRAMPVVAVVDFAHGAARETLPVPAHGLVVVAAAITDPREPAVFTARDADGATVDRLAERFLNGSDESAGWPAPDLWATGPAAAASRPPC